MKQNANKHCIQFLTHCQSTGNCQIKNKGKHYLCNYNKELCILNKTLFLFSGTGSKPLAVNFHDTAVASFSVLILIIKKIYFFDFFKYFFFNQWVKILNVQLTQIILGRFGYSFGVLVVKWLTCPKVQIMLELWIFF